MEYLSFYAKKGQRFCSSIIAKNKCHLNLNL